MSSVSVHLRIPSVNLIFSLIDRPLRKPFWSLSIILGKTIFKRLATAFAAIL